MTGLSFKDWFQVEELMPWIRSRLKKLVSNPSDREDIASEVYLVLAKVLKGDRARPTDPQKIYAWLNQVVKGVVSEYFRKKQPHLMPHDSPLLDRPIEPETSPMELQYIKRAVDELPEYMRQVIVMYYFQDKKFGEIAQELGIPISTAKRRAFDGRQLLKTRLEKYQ